MITILTRNSNCSNGLDQYCSEYNERKILNNGLNLDKLMILGHKICKSAPSSTYKEVIECLATVFVVYFSFIFYFSWIQLNRHFANYAVFLLYS